MWQLRTQQEQAACRMQQPVCRQLIYTHTRSHRCVRIAKELCGNHHKNKAQAEVTEAVKYVQKVHQPQLPA